MDTIDPERLLVFRAVARSGGFSAAARELGRSQPSVSQLVAALEAQLGRPLFIRDGRTIALTGAGEILLEHAEKILAEMTRTLEHLASAAALREGRLALGTTDTLACHLLPGALGEFRKRYPGIELRIDTRPSPVIAERVAARELDLGIVSSPVRANARLAFETLAPHHDVAIVPRGHALATRKRLRIEELAEHPLLLLDRTTGTRAFVERELQKRGLQPRIAMESTSVEVMIRLVELGFGASIVPAIAVARANVVKLPIVGGERREVIAVTPASGTSSAAAAFVKIAAEQMAYDAKR